MEATPERDGAIFPLRGRPPVVLHETGLRHPRGLWRRREGFTAYADLTHVVAGARGLRLGSREGSASIRRSDFRDPLDAARLAAAVRRRVAGLPDGDARLARMERLDRRLLERPRPRLARLLVLLCLVAFLLQGLSPQFEMVGMFNADLVRLGELWRLVTANFLHGGVAHLALNAVGLLVLGGLLETMLGRRRSLFVFAVSGVSAMAGSLLGDYPYALGASGIVAGVVGALLWLEFRRPEQVPGPWRLPRALLVGAVLADAVVLAFVPNVAHWAHGGGLLGGMVAAALVVPPRPEEGEPRWLPAADAVAAGAAVAAAAALLWAVWSPDPDAARQRAQRLLAIERLPPMLLNNEAWTIAVSEEPSPELLRVAERLAERAVARTARRDPNVLDTLAEVQFARGDVETALETIGEAIALAPEEPYFQEQRRRFTGERAVDDRPEPPEEPVLPAPRAPPSWRAPEPEEPPGLRV